MFSPLLNGCAFFDIGKMNYTANSIFAAFIFKNYYMQKVTCSRLGKLYHLGDIMPINVDNKLQYLIIPTFVFHPPFICLTLIHAQRRLRHCAALAFENGDTVPMVRQNFNYSVIPTEFHIDF